MISWGSILYGAALSALLAGGLFGWLAARSSNKIAREAVAQNRRANETAEQALAENRRANETAERDHQTAVDALEEARQARKIQYADWLHQAKPTVEVRIADLLTSQGGMIVRFRCDKDLSSARVSLVAGYNREAFRGVGPSPTLGDPRQGLPMETWFHLPDGLEAGRTAEFGLWISDAGQAIGSPVDLRFELTSGEDQWPVVETMQIPSQPRNPER